MRQRLEFIFAAIVFVFNAWSQDAIDDFILVEGGSFQNEKSSYYASGVILSSFYIGRYEVTQGEWKKIMESNPSNFKGDQFPIEMVSWYDCVEYCNQRSINEGLAPYYTIEKDTEDPINGNVLDDIKWKVSINTGARGYRLPTEMEWEYAASGGQRSKNYTYSGSNDVDEVAWYWQNSGDTYLTGSWHWPMLEHNNCRTKAIGSKEPNELGIYDMSGNVREWCWDSLSNPTSNGNRPGGKNEGFARTWKGGGWVGGDFCCELSFRGSFEANGVGNDQGFRLCRDK